MNPKSGDTANNPSLPPQRVSEAATVASLLRPGSAVLIAAHPGEFRTAVARTALESLGGAVSPSLRCSHLTSEVQLSAWYEEQLPMGVALLEDVDVLPHELADAVSAILEDPRLRVVATIDTVAMRTARVCTEHSVVGAINELWRRRVVSRVDLAPLNSTESLDFLRQGLHPQRFDALQEAVLIRTAGGSVAVLRDLAKDVLSAPRRVPQHMTSAWTVGLPLSTSTIQHVASRYRDLSEELRREASLLHQLGPFTYSTATRVFGAHTLSQLEAVGLTTLEGPERNPRVHIGSLEAAALVIDGAPPGIDERLRSLTASMRTLRHTGYPLSVATDLVVARQLMGSGEEPVASDGPLLAAAAQTSALRGHGQVAESMACKAIELGSADEAVPTLWLALALQNRHQEILDQAEALLATSPESFTSSHLHRAAIAASWRRTPPQWLLRALEEGRGVVSPGHAFLFARLTDGEGYSAQALERFGEISRDLDEPDAVRLWAYSFLIAAATGTSDVEMLEPLITAGHFLRARTGRTLEHLPVWQREAMEIFEVCCVSARLLAGIDTEHAHTLMEEFTAKAIGFGPASGRLPTSLAAYLHAMNCFLIGDVEGARLNLATCESLLDRSSFAALNVALAEFAAILGHEDCDSAADAAALATKTRNTSHPPVFGRMNMLAARFVPEDAATPADVTPAEWTLVSHAHRRVLAQPALAQGELDALPEDVLAASFPTTVARLTHLRGLAQDDPDLLVEAADGLEATGQAPAARQALEAARSRFLARRQTSKANECTDRLGQFPSAAEPMAPAEDRGAIPGGLTRREYEICVLVGAGLTNAQIGDRLFLSVRTVESHVLQARAKLGAQRRRDIPERLAKAGGLIG